MSDEVETAFPAERTDCPPENGNPRGGEEEEDWNVGHRTKLESSRRHQKEGRKTRAGWENLVLEGREACWENSREARGMGEEIGLVALGVNRAYSGMQTV